MKALEAGKEGPVKKGYGYNSGSVLNQGASSDLHGVRGQNDGSTSNILGTFQVVLGTPLVDLGRLSLTV